MKPLTAGQQKLIQENIPLAFYFVGRKKFPERFREDIISACFEGLTTAAINWDPKRGKFSTLAFYCMASKITNMFHILGTPVKIPSWLPPHAWVGDKKYSRLVTQSLERAYETPSDVFKEDQNLFADEDLSKSISVEQSKLILKKMLSSLTAQQRSLIRRIYGIGTEKESLREISKTMDISKQAVHIRAKKTLEKMRHIAMLQGDSFDGALWQ